MNDFLKFIFGWMFYWKYRLVHIDGSPRFFGKFGIWLDKIIWKKDIEKFIARHGEKGNEKWVK